MIKNNNSINIRTPHKTKKYWAWAIGGPIGLIMTNLWGRIQYFSTHILLIPQMTIFIIYLIYSTVDAFNDPIIGYIADRSTRYTEKYGKRFPWILIGRIIQPLFLILCFIPISQVVNDPSNIILSIVWLIIMMCLFETFATISEINQSALFPDLFRGQNERSKSIRASQIISIIYQVLVPAIIIPLILGRLGGQDVPEAYLGTTIIFSILFYVMLIPFSYGAYENKEIRAFRVKLDKERKSSSALKETLIRIFSDRNWMAYVIMFTLYSIAGICFLNGLPFFFFDGLGYDVDSIQAMLPQLIVLIMTFVGSLIFIPLVKKYGAKKSGVLSLILFSLFFILMFSIIILPVGLLNIFCIFGGLSYGGVIVTGIYIGAEAIDNAVIKSGKREEGSYNGILRIFTAYSYALQTLIFATVSLFTGFVSGETSTYTIPAKIGLLVQISVIPFFIMLIGVIVFALMYDITKENALRNTEKLKEIGL
jgi:GPH family glycoside/pentoside/hexuronide:cation symporter